MQANQYDVYAQFLLECKKVMGTVNFERLDADTAYLAEICQRVIAQADDRLFEIAALVNREIDSEESKDH